MSARQLEQVARIGYAAATRGDLDDLLAILDPGIEFNSLIAEMEGRTFRGHAGVREWWSNVATALGGLRYEPEEIEVSGVTGVVRLRVTGTAAGVEIPQTMWHALRINQDGKVIWWYLARSRAEAREAAGLPQ